MCATEDHAEGELLALAGGGTEHFWSAESIKEDTSLA